MKVVSVTAAKQHLYTIVFDDGLSGSIDKTVWEHSGVAVDAELDDDAWEALCVRSQVYRAKEKALYYLSLRDYGSGELRSKLRQAGIDKELATATVERLCESGLIDDARYATALARDMSERKLYPKRRVAMALREKGFSAEVIEQAIEKLDAQEAQQALELLYKKRYNGKSDPKTREKALAMLARYGFSYAACKQALALWDAENDEDGSDLKE